MVQRRHVILALVAALVVDAAAFALSGPEHPVATWVGLWLSLTLVALVLAPLLEGRIARMTAARLTTPPPVVAVLPLGVLGAVAGPGALNVLAALYGLASEPGLGALGRLAENVAWFVAASVALRWAVSRWARASTPGATRGGASGRRTRRSSRP